MFSVRNSYYFPAIESTLGTRYVPGYDATPWLEFFTLALHVEAKKLTDDLTDWRRIMIDVQDVLEAMGMKRRQADALMYVYRTGRITRPEYIEITGTSPGTASRDLAQLVQRRLLVAEGETKARVYRKSEDLLARLKQLIEQRPWDNRQASPGNQQ